MAVRSTSSTTTARCADLNESALQQRLDILSVTPGQQYIASVSPSTRFTGSGEFRADNEPYGVMVTFVASGEDLPHPDPEAERERSARQRAAKAQAADEDKAESKPAKVELTVRNAAGAIVRKQKFEVHQGVNRIAWGMRHDGVRPPAWPRTGQARGRPARRPRSAAG